MVTAVAIFVLLGIILVLPNFLVDDLAEHSRNLLRKMFNLLVAAWSVYWIIVFFSGADRTPTSDVKRGGIVAAAQIAIGIVCAWAFREFRSDLYRPVQFTKEFRVHLTSGTPVLLHLTFELPKKWLTQNTEDRINTAVTQAMLFFFMKQATFPEPATIISVAEKAVAETVNELKTPVRVFITKLLKLESDKPASPSGDPELELDDSH